MRAPGLLLLVLVAATASAEPAAVGTALAAFSVEDQHGETHRLDESVSVLLFSRDMKGGSLLKEALAGRDATYLEECSALYLADISGMPRLIARAIAVPRMRRRPYPVLLDRDGSLTRDLPDQEEKATLIFLDRLRVTRVEHLDSAEAVRDMLDGAGGAASGNASGSDAD